MYAMYHADYVQNVIDIIHVHTHAPNRLEAAVQRLLQRLQLVCY